MSSSRRPVTVTLQPWFRDHCFAGKIILPAVETMLLLAAEVADVFPAVDIRVMEEIRFAKFLELPPESVAGAEALIETASDTEGKRVEAKLLTRIPCGRMSRIREHGQVFFPLIDPGIHPTSQVDPAPPNDLLKKISAEYLYRELVPFGPQYQTLQETLYLGEDSAWGILKAPGLPAVHAVQYLLGSPFPLDGAMHAASVLGHRQLNIIAFPVAIDRRVILRPTRPDGEYLTKVTAVALTEKEQVFDLLIFDRAGIVYEAANGLRMRDVSRTVPGN